jgi:DNA-binding CsgD family transcriptional regulator
VLSPETVRTHIRNAREKLGASTRVEAVTMALLGREIQL